MNWPWAALASIAGVALLGGCGNSPPLNQTPLISNLFPSNIVAGSAEFTLSVVGAGFVSNARGASFVYWNGFPRSTTLNQTTGELEVQILASDIAFPASLDVTVVNPAPGGGTSTAVGFTIEPLRPDAPVIASLSPANTKAGGAAFTLTVNGSGFLPGAQVQWNTVNLTTTFVSSTQLTAQVPASDISMPAAVNVTVLNPGAVSAPIAFTITTLTPTLTSMSPTSAPAGGMTSSGCTQPRQRTCHAGSPSTSTVTAPAATTPL